MKYRSVAIDGPSGAGKSTLARQLAEELGFLYVDTGAIYRTAALKAYRSGVNPADGEGVTSLLNDLEIGMAYGENGEQKMYLGAEDVSEEIRLHAISSMASQISAIPEVRACLLHVQRKLARQQDVVMDGRDIATVVLPDADVKIFLTARPETRAKRRLNELLLRGQQADFDTVLRDIISRDNQDRGRAVSPLRQAEDAVLLDTTDMNLNDSAQALLSIVKEGLNL